MQTFGHRLREVYGFTESRRVIKFYDISDKITK